MAKNGPTPMRGASAQQPDPRRQQQVPSLRQPSRIVYQAVKLGALSGAVPGAGLEVFLLMLGGPGAIVLLPGALLMGAMAGAVEGLLAGCGLRAFARVVRRSLLMASTVSAVSVSVLPVVTIVVWFRAQLALGAGTRAFFVTACALTFVAGAVLGPRAVAEKGYWAARFHGPAGAGRSGLGKGDDDDMGRSSRDG